MRPAVSILLPVRDEAKHLPAALTSLQRQTHTDWELVAVDDGSRDATPQILASAAAADQRIRILRRPAEGLVAALNAGLELCRAGLTARMDGDDICHPQRLELQLAHLRRHPQLDLLACRVRHFPRPHLQEGMRAYEDWQNELLSQEQILANLFVESPFAHPSVIYRTERVRDLGGYRQRDWAEDYDLWLRMAAAGAQFARLPRTLLYWRDRPQRLTRTAENCSLDAFRRCKAHFLRRGYLKQHPQVRIWGAGMEGKLWRKVLQAEGIGVAAWIDIDPKKIGQRIHQAQVVAPEEILQRSEPILVCVGTRGARKLIRAFCHNQGMIEGRDYLCVT